MANKNLTRYAQELRPYLEEYKNRKPEAKATKQKSKDSSQEEPSANTQSSSAVTGPEFAVVPDGVRTSKRKSMSGGDGESEANETPTEDLATRGIAGSAKTWNIETSEIPMWTPTSEGPRMPGGHGIPRGNELPGEDETLQRTGMLAQYGTDGTWYQHGTTLRRKRGA